ncbi:hypothetical protein BCR42DRAFT_301950, partial [Absidia repens]
QQLILQARWLKNLLVPSFHSSLITNMLHHHLSSAGPPDSPSLLPLLFPHLRYGALTSPRHVLSLIFKAFDGLRLDLDFTKATSDMCLHLPLTVFFSNISTNHWLLQKGHRKDQGHTFFVIDEILHCLRPKVDTDQRRYPRLLKHLLKDVL